MTVEQLRRKAGHFQLVDVRSASEFASGHIPGTVNVPMEQAEKRVADFDLKAEVVLICKSGTRAQHLWEQVSRLRALRIFAEWGFCSRECPGTKASVWK